MAKKKCPYCGKNDKVRGHGTYSWKTTTKRFACYRCHKTFH